MGIDERLPNKVVKTVSQIFPGKSVITTDVGQNQVWVAQSLVLKGGERVLFSGGHGAMGYSFPAAIGAYYASNHKPVICISGDGGMQMNIQELQYIKRENIPIKLIVLNNNSLGMIRHFQEMYFEGEYYQTKPEGGYSAPSFTNIARAYGIQGMMVNGKSLEKDICIHKSAYLKAFMDDKPFLLEIIIDEDTYVYPKLEYGKPNQDQEPLLDRETYEKIMQMHI